MKTKSFFTTLSMLAILFMCNPTSNAINNNGQLVYNPIEQDGVLVGQTVYKMGETGLKNYMQYNYKYDENQRMTESEMMKWNSSDSEWEKDLRINYTYEGKTITTNYYKWNNRKQTYVLVPEMTITMDNPNL